MSARVLARTGAAVAVTALLGAVTVNAQSTFPGVPDTAVQTQGHAGHGDPQEQQTPAPQEDHSAHQMPAEKQEKQEYPADIPPITDEDRAAAFPKLNGQHTVHDDAVHYFVLFDQLEWQTGSGVNAGSWDVRGWVGQDVNRFWFRTEGEGISGRLTASQAHAFYGRAISPWWTLVAGVRQDVRPGPAQTWAAIGIQGLAPYWFEVEATAYVGGGGRTHFRFETEYEWLLTNRLVLQPLVEVEIYGKSDPEHGMARGLSTADAGLRLRYEFRREIAPYVGVTWHRKFFGTADLAEAAGETTSTTRLALGLRVWF